MKRFPKWIFTFFFLIIFFICVPTLVKAGPGDGGCDPLDPTCPIDGGLTALLAIGVVYGIKKVKDSRNAESKRIKN